ncbi:hypothetical protein PR048_029145 [Dryococelus australis]|uniref:Uncharacterized protein n=1 Tax=Dryococelus australis TaxID=614101 RepID=A0ABQ9GFC0_9NEOP|nr:hypothetical protein PR048_029145 [Dryococelus australis]
MLSLGPPLVQVTITNYVQVCEPRQASLNAKSLCQSQTLCPAGKLPGQSCTPGMHLYPARTRLHRRALNYKVRPEGVLCNNGGHMHSSTNSSEIPHYPGKETTYSTKGGVRCELSRGLEEVGTFPTHCGPGWVGMRNEAHVHIKLNKVSLLASHHGEPGSIPGWVTPRFLNVVSCWKMLLVSKFSRGSPVSPALSFWRCSILVSITLISSQDLAVKELPKSLHSFNMDGVSSTDAGNQLMCSGPPGGRHVATAQEASGLVFRKGV